METLFHVTFQNPAGFLISFIPGLINLCLLVYIILYLPRNKIINIFGFLTFSLICWQFNDAMNRLAETVETAVAWEGAFASGWMLMAPLCLHFTLFYTGFVKEQHSRGLTALLYLPSLVLIGFYNAKIFPHSFQYFPLWGWVNGHNKNILDSINVFWMAGLMVISNVLLVVHTIKSRHHKDLYYQSLLITLGIACPTVSGMITEVVMPQLFHVNAVPVTSTFMTLFSVFTAVALTRFRLFRMSDLVNSEQLLDALPTLVIGLTPARKLNYANEYTCKTLMLSKSDLFNLPVDEALTIADPAHRASFNAGIEHALNGGETMNIESSAILSSGKIDTLLSIMPVINNYEVQAVIISMRDITEIKQSHELITQSEAQLKEAQHLAKIGSWEWNIITNEVKWSDELHKIFGIPKDQITTYECYLEALHPDDRNRVNEIVHKAYETKEPFEFSHRTNGNTDTIIHALGNVQLNEAGVPVKMYGTAQDVTEMKKHELQLQEQNQELQKINSELDRFVYSVSHDLRSPLTSIQGIVNIAMEETQDAEMKQYLGMISSSAEKLDKFIVDILDYSRNARMEVDTEQIDMHQLVAEIISQYQLEPRVTIEVHKNPKEEATFCSDRRRLMMILNNLISNAVRYADPNTAHPFVKLGLEISAEKALITVADNGIGIPEDIQPRVFEMFFRGANETPGSGLGLYIVKEAVEKLGGKILLDSAPGKGTVFVLELPNSIAHQQESAGFAGS